MQIKECIVRLNDQVINAADYTECIIRGFCRAYMVTMADKKVEVMLSGFFDGRSRVVLRPYPTVCNVSYGFVSSGLYEVKRMQESSFECDSQRGGIFFYERDS